MADTAAFYNANEKAIDSKMCGLREKLARERKALQIIQNYHSGQLKYEKALSQLATTYRHDVFFIPDKDEISEIYDRITQINRELKTLKGALKSEFQKSDGRRCLRPESASPNHVISVFESSLTRTLKLNTNELTSALIIVRIFFYEIFKDLVLNGFDFDGEHYVVLTASAGQIRTKKCVFIKEALLSQYRDTIMCGLTVDRINAMGGCNVNKYLAYLALVNSATDEWPEFNVRKSIVVDDLETMVRGVVDYIDDKTYSITRQEMDVPINQTDGCGMVLPRLTGGKNTMVRLPWVKGLLASFPFDEFITEKSMETGRNVGIVKDAYGVEHDVLAEGIEVILSKSQFKMQKFYSNWQEYCDLYEKHGCHAGICNMEPDYIGNATIGYQMLQSLTDLSDDELTKLSSKTRYRLEHISNDRKAMLRSLGATKGNRYINAAQECLLIYPELLQDEHYRESLRNLKQSIEKWAWGGKLDIFAKYLFIIPDLFAFCEFLFLGDKNPDGLLGDGQVYAAQFATSDRLDCLRSPSLYREHPVRENAVNNPECARWFGRNGLYTSCHDLISKIIMNDFDGDMSLVCAEQTLIDAAHRNMKDIVPLYYEMRKAAPQQITMAGIYDGITTAFSGGNIGPISNNITKIWNSKKPDTDVIKWLCYKTNETIDFSKTLYKSIAPKDVSKRISAATNSKVPHFFIYAKDKTVDQVERRGKSPIDRLLDIIPKYRFKFNAKLGGKFDYRMLMSNPDLIHTTHVDELIREYNIRVSKMDPNLFDCEEDDRAPYQFQLLREHMFLMATNDQYVVDALVFGLFHLKKTRHKNLFWGAFGEMVLENLQRNLELYANDSVLCSRCYCRFVPSTFDPKCPVCGTRSGNVRVAPCIDCGEEFSVDARNTTKVRCSRCQKEKDRENGLKRTRKYRGV